MLDSIYTIGHGNITAKEFFNNLKRYSIDAIVDIRSKPYSNYVPHFNKESLKALCNKNKISYFYLGDLLGGRPDDPSIYRTETKVDYNILAKKPFFAQGIDRLSQIVKTHNACLVCSEEQPDNCHRNLLVAPALEKLGVKVSHILPDGSITNSDDLFLKKNHGQLAFFK